MADIRIIKHEAVPKCGSFEVRFKDGRPSTYFYWEDLPGHRLRQDLVTRWLWSRPKLLLELSAIGDGQQELAPAGDYVTALSKSEQSKPHWQTAAHWAAARDRIVMLAEIAMRQALDYSAFFRVG